LHIKENEAGLIYIDEEIIQAIFSCVYGLNEKDSKTKKLLKNEKFNDFMHMLLLMQEYNYRYRFSQFEELFPLFEETVGPMERNSEGTSYWLAMGLALKDLYGFRNRTLKSLLIKLKNSY